MTDASAEDLYDVELNLTLRSSEEGEIVLRQHALGAGPLITVVPSYDEASRLYTFTVDATDCGRPEDLADTFESLAKLLRGTPVAAAE